MLNDIAGPTRLLVAGFGAAVGVMLGGVVVGAPSGATLVALLVGVAVELVLLVVFPVALGRAEGRFRDVVTSATTEIATGAVASVPALGRVVRGRTLERPWWLPGRGGGEGAAVLLVLTAVGDGAPRRVAAVVPRDLGLGTSGVPAVLLVHPEHRDVAVVDDRVTPELLAQVDADPRWTDEALPTDRTVVGGYLGLLVAVLVGAAAGVGLSAAVVTLAT